MTSCYYINDRHRVNMGMAVQNCKENGAHLVEPATKEEYNEIMNVFKRPSRRIESMYSQFWIGLQRSPSLDYTFITSHVNPQYIPWDHSFPYGKDCVFLTPYFMTTRDERCERENYFICQRTDNIHIPTTSPEPTTSTTVYETTTPTGTTSLSTTTVKTTEFPHNINSTASPEENNRKSNAASVEWVYSLLMVVVGTNLLPSTI